MCLHATDRPGPEGVHEQQRVDQEVRQSGPPRAHHPQAGHAGGPIAVLVQRMLAPEAAGVAFTADPVTGARGDVVVTAGRGLGERVVSGEAVGDEWVVHDGAPTCRRSTERAIDADQAVEIAALARRVEAHVGAPQDVEWAIESGRLHLLQARPMTALPDPIDWTPPGPGYWMRSFRTARDFYAIGSDPAAARLAGIPVGSRVFLAFVLSGAIAGLTGALWLSLYASVDAIAGVGYEFQVIAAVVVGGVAIFGGSGTVLGAALGALLLYTINSALVVVNVSSFWSMALSGALLLAAIAFDRLIALRVAPAMRTRRRARG